MVQCRGSSPPTPPESSKTPPPSFGGAGGLWEQRPPLEQMSDADIDAYAEWCYNRSLENFIAGQAAIRRPRRMRRMYEYSAKNCEEAYASDAAKVHLARV